VTVPSLPALLEEYTDFLQQRGVFGRNDAPGGEGGERKERVRPGSAIMSEGGRWEGRAAWRCVIESTCEGLCYGQVRARKRRGRGGKKRAVFSRGRG
jgi:hypothetical protein